MANKLQRKRENRSPIRDRPSVRRIFPQIDHAARNRKYTSIHVLEVLRDTVHTYKEACGFEFFGSGCPFHVYAEEVAEERFGEVE